MSGILRSPPLNKLVMGIEENDLPKNLRIFCESDEKGQCTGRNGQVTANADPASEARVPGEFGDAAIP